MEHEAQQPRLTTEADVEPDTKSRKRTEGASAADRVKNGDSSSARVDDGPMSFTSFGMIAEAPAPEKCINNGLVNKGAVAPKPHLPPVEVGMLSLAVGGLLPAGTASTAVRAVFLRSLFSWSLGEMTNERTGRADLNELAPSSWGGRLYKQNQGKLWCLIWADVQVAYAVARFWEGGARCFVGNFVWTPDGI